MAGWEWLRLEREPFLPEQSHAGVHDIGVVKLSPPFDEFCKRRLNPQCRAIRPVAEHRESTHRHLRHLGSSAQDRVREPVLEREVFVLLFGQRTGQSWRSRTVQSDRTNRIEWTADCVVVVACAIFVGVFHQAEFDPASPGCLVPLTSTHGRKMGKKMIISC